MLDSIDKIVDQLLEKVTFSDEKINDIKSAIGDFFAKCKQEGIETIEMADILQQQLSGQTVDQNQIEKAKQQAVDLLRIIGIGLPQLIPLPLVGTVSLFVILKLGKIFDITVVPSAWKNTNTPKK